MNKKFDIKVVNGVPTRKKYVSPEIEVVNLDEQPKLLYVSGASGAAGWGNGLLDDNDEWSE